MTKYIAKDVIPATSRIVLIIYEAESNAKMIAEGAYSNPHGWRRYDGETWVAIDKGSVIAWCDTSISEVLDEH